MPANLEAYSSTEKSSTVDTFVPQAFDIALSIPFSFSHNNHGSITPEEPVFLKLDVIDFIRKYESM